MKKSRLAALTMLLAATSILSSCVWEGYDGYRDENHHERDRGDRHDRDRGDHHDGDHERDHGDQG